MRRAGVLFILLCMAAVRAAAVSLNIDSAVTQDSDRTSITEHMFAIEQPLKKGMAVGAWCGYSLYGENGGGENASSAGGTFRYSFSDEWSGVFSGGMFACADRSSFVGEGGVAFEKNRFRAELYAGEEPVETRLSLSRGITLASAGIGIDIPVIKNVLLVAGGDARRFSDGNERNGIILKGIYETPVEGVSLQVWHRDFRDSEENGNGYFNPRSMDYQRCIVSFRRRIHGAWKAFVQTGPGLQRVNGENATGTFLFQGTVEGPVAGGLALKLGYISADSAYDDSLLGYRYNTLSAGLSCQFR